MICSHCGCGRGNAQGRYEQCGDHKATWIGCHCLIENAESCSPVKYSSITSLLLYSSDVEEYKNVAIKIFSKFMQRNNNMDNNIKSEDEEKNKNMLASIDFNAPKIKKY